MVATNGKITKTVSQLIRNLSPRNRDIITRRFGLKTGKKETLESIGKSYGITRERVRQIEEFTFNQLAKAPNTGEISEYVSTTKKILSESGGVMRERELFKAFSGNEKDSVTNASLAFVLTLSKEVARVNENNDFHSFWALSDEHAKNFKDSVAKLISSLNQQKKVMHEQDFAGFVKVKVPEASAQVINAILNVSKSLDKNIFSEVGLVEWPEIHPRGVKDKAYLVLKKEKEPKHFSDIAKLINSVNFSARKANIQTVHNELIKDNRFVLVGRGTYALSEWGYNPGTVKDVLVGILKNSTKPLAKAELVSKTREARMVKENTILLNLQDSKVFERRDDGTYSLKKA